MAKFSAVKTNWTPTATADAPTALTAGGFMAIKGGSATTRSIITEIYMGGMAAVTSPMQMVLARDSTVFSGATSNAVQLNTLDPLSATLSSPPLAQDVGSTTLPQRGVGLYLVTPAFNPFGGIVKWVAPPGYEPGISGNTANNGEVSLSSLSTGTPGLILSHILFETV